MGILCLFDISFQKSYIARRRVDNAQKCTIPKIWMVPLEFFNMSLDPTIRHTFWTQSVGGMFIFLSIYAVNQAQVQRLLATKSLKSAQKALWLQWPILALLSCITSFAGLVIYAHYKGMAW